MCVLIWFWFWCVFVTQWNIWTRPPYQQPIGTVRHIQFDVQVPLCFQVTFRYSARRRYVASSLLTLLLLGSHLLFFFLPLIIIIKYVYIAHGRTMRWVVSYALKSSVFSLFLNMFSEMSGARSSATLPATIVKSHSSFSYFPCWFKDSIQRSFQRCLLCTTTPTSDLARHTAQFNMAQSHHSLARHTAQFNMAQSHHGLAWHTAQFNTAQSHHGLARHIEQLNLFCEFLMLTDFIFLSLYCMYFVFSVKPSVNHISIIVTCGVSDIVTYLVCAVCRRMRPKSWSLDSVCAVCRWTRP